MGLALGLSNPKTSTQNRLNPPPPDSPKSPKSHINPKQHSRVHVYRYFPSHVKMCLLCLCGRRKGQSDFDLGDSTTLGVGLGEVRWGGWGVER